MSIIIGRCGEEPYPFVAVGTTDREVEAFFTVEFRLTRAFMRRVKRGTWKGREFYRISQKMVWNATRKGAVWSDSKEIGDLFAEAQNKGGGTRGREHEKVV
jgi:hypothetical protein